MADKGGILLKSFMCIALYVSLTIILTITVKPGRLLKHILERQEPKYDGFFEVHETLNTTNHDNFINQKQLITLFTTASLNNKSWKTVFYENTFTNWAALRPYVTPVFYYVEDGELAKWAYSHGWETLKAPKTNKNKTPILRAMFIDAEKKFNSHFYGYANADILFTDGLVRTLEGLMTVIEKTKQLLVTGQRSNVAMTNIMTINTSHLAKKTKLFGTDAQDYFITKKGGYDWLQIPDFVVGRVGYDNWLVVHAIRSNMMVIDATNTLTALHQTGIGGNYEGASAPKNDRLFNYKQAGLKFDYSLGRTTCAEFFTEYDIFKSFYIKHRSMKNNTCKSVLKLYKINYDKYRINL